MAIAIPLSDLPVVDKSTGPDFNTENFQSGAVILMDKPLDWSSFDVVRYVRNRVPPKKVGHAGTLDPLATGLLVLCTGKATKSISQVQELPKTYEATIKFGASTPSYDAATDADEHDGWEHITPEAIKNTISEEFSGEISQVPPMYSAIQVKGQRLYKLARRGEKINLMARPVIIHNVEIIDVSLPSLQLRVRCSKGTYIRSLAHDLGLALNSRAHLSGLRRTEIGHFCVDNALSVDEIDVLCKDLRG